MPGGGAKAAAELLGMHVAAAAARAGYAMPGSIPDGMTFLQWCQDLQAKGMKIDRKPFRLDDRAALVPLYEAIPSTREEAQDLTLIIQKATQLGLTVWEVLATLYMALKFGPVNIGLFLPDMATAGFKSEHRFMPIVRSAPELYTHLIHQAAEDGSKRKVGEGNVLTRQVDRSLLMFLWTTGKVSTESRPMDIVTLDEVQEMALAHIDKVRARTGDSELRTTLMLSTANMPEVDINFWYQLGTREVWHTRCLSCGVLSDLSDPVLNFPARSIRFNSRAAPLACTGHNGGPPMDDYVWTCPACGGWIPDPQVGSYVRTNPAASPKMRSFLLPRTISPRQTPRMMIEAFQRARTGDQKKSFWNRSLARPYVDPDQIPVTLEHCEAAAAEGVAMGLTWKDSARETYMGVDQMGGWCAVIIKERLPDGRQAVVHVEAVFDLDPFKRVDALMGQYGVAVCAVEQLPNVNDARKLANKHRGRVFLVNYSPSQAADMVAWGDALSRSDLKTAVEDRSRYSVTVQQYKAMQAALVRVRDKGCLFPDPGELEQDVYDEAGKLTRVPLLREWVFLHFTKTALVVEHDEETRKPQPRVLKVGIDPHFSFANMLCDVAWSRVHGMGMMLIPPGAAELAKERAAVDKIDKAMPGLPQHVKAMMQDAPAGTCGACEGFQEGRCVVRGLVVKATDPECPLYVARG